MPEVRSKLLRHPRRVLLVAVVCLLALGALGKDVEGQLTPSALVLPGTESSRAESQAEKYFGESAPFTVLLRGPAAQLDRRGPRLVRELQRDPAVTTVSPWDKGTAGALRPHPNAALIIVDFHVGVGEAVKHTVAHLDRVVAAHVSPPMRATTTGFATLLAGTKEAWEEAGKRGELITIPVLLIVLLFVFRSPIAAAIPLGIGIVTVIASRGIISILSRWMEIDPIAPAVASMMGLALGVDYALLMVSRFREELGTMPALQAAAETRRTAGRTIVVAGTTLFCSLFVAFLVIPEGIFTSLNGAVILATALSVIAAWVLGPAVLTLLGERINRWQIGASRTPRWKLIDLVRGVLRRPGPAAAAIAALVLAVAIPLFSLQMGTAGLDQLPPDSQVRRDADLINQVVGPGWGTPFTVIASSGNGSIARQGRLDAIEDWQREIRSLSGVRAVIGPGQAAKAVGPLRKQGNELLAGGPGSTVARTRQLGSRLGLATDGVSKLRDGLAQGSQGAGLLGLGSERAAAGASALAKGVGQLASGGEQATGGIERLSDGTRRLVSGQRSARFGGLQLKLGLDSLQPYIGRHGLGEARPLQAELARRAATEPELQDDADRAARLVTQLQRAKRETARLRRLAAKLYAGLGKLADGGTKLQDGVGELSRASQRLSGGLQSLDGGSQRLAAGVSRLSGGADVLETKLAEGFHQSRPLQKGLRTSSAKIADESRELTGGVRRLRESSPGLFDSGYFALSVLDGASPDLQQNIDQVVDVRGGGKAVRMFVIGNRSLSSPGATALYSDLRSEAAGLSRETHTDVVVGGGIVQLIDYADFATSRLPILILIVTLTTIVMLVVLLRSLLLPVIAVLLNLVTVAVSFGVLSLVSQIPAGYPLGGHRVLDVGAVMSIFAVAFSLSIDYAVFLVTRMRESYDQDHDHERAVYMGLEKTARVVTGAAVVMGAVFLAYASAPLAMMSQLGVGLAVAVLVDATVIRIVLLPALMLLLGDRVWWLPPALGRMLPRLRVD